MRQTCGWSQEDEGGDWWSTGCGHAFTINDGTPVENSMRFCCFCGGALIEKLWADAAAEQTAGGGKA